MTEFKVWRTIVDWVEEQNGIVYAACPPGSSVFDYDKFCIIDPVSQKRDEPDILFSIGNILYIVECKPSLNGILRKDKKKSNDENDIDKLRRIKTIYDKGNYEQQLLDNYGVQAKKFKLKIGVGFAYSARQPKFDFDGIVGFEVDSDKKIKMVSK